MPWQKIYDTTVPPVGVRTLWTRAIVQNKLYFFRQGNPFILELDTSTPGAVEIIEQVDTNGFVNMDAIEGVFEARSRLGLWDTDNSHYWGDTADVLNFTPDLRTRANTVKVDALKGNIILVLGSTEGFITYTTANIVGGTYAQQSQKVFNFFEIADNLGIFSDYSVTKAEDGTHFAYTNGGLYKVSNNKGGLQPFATEVTDYLTSFQQSPRLSHHLNRYLAVWLHDEGIEFGRTIRQKNFVDAATYWRQQFAYPDYLNNPGVFLEALTPDAGYPFNDGFPFACYPEVGLCPPETASNILWGMAVQEYPNYELEKIELDIVEWDDTGVPLQFIPVHKDPITGEIVAATSYKRNQWVATEASTADIRLNHRGFALGVFNRFGFDPHELLMYQSYVWQAEDKENADHILNDSIMADDELSSVNDQWEHTVTFRDPSPQLISDTTVVDDDIRDDFKKGTYETVFEHDLNTNEFVFTNLRIIETEVFGPNTRTTKIESFTVRFSDTPITTVESPSDFGARDGEIITGPTPVVTVPPADSTTDGVVFLANPRAGSLVGAYEVDFNFQTEFNGLIAVDGESDKAEIDFNRAFQEIVALGDSTSNPATDYRKWSTGSTLAATSDRCTYGNLRNFTKNRGITATEITRTFTTRLQYAGDDIAGDSIYIHIREQTVDVKYNIERLYPDLPNLPVAPTTIPQKYDLYPVPLATITRLDGANPSAVIKQYYEDSVIEGVDIRQIYLNNGWIVAAPPSAVPFVPPTFQQASPPAGNWYNGTDPSGTFLEYFLKGLQCGKLTPFGVWPWNIDTVGKFQEGLEPIPSLPDLTGPETVFLTQTGAPGQFFPTWTRVIIWDRLLERWGTCDVPLSLFIDFSPINEVTYDPILEEAVTRFTYDNFLSRLGAVLESGVTTMWDDAPEDSFIVYGKIGFRRSKITMMQEIFLEFAENPNANIILESSLDRRTLDPYNMRSEPIFRAGHTWYGTISARWFNIIVRGSRWHLTGLEYMGSTLGKE